MSLIVLTTREKYSKVAVYERLNKSSHYKDHEGKQQQQGGKN
jgi:hypothetical protein